MSDVNEQETGHGMGDDRDYFEEDFRGPVPGTWTELPEGYDVPAAEDIDPRFTAFFQRDLVGDIQSYDFSRATDGDIERVMSWVTDLRPGSALEWPEEAAVQLRGVSRGFDFYVLLGRKELDDAETKRTISDLQKNGVVTIVDGKTGLSMDADAYRSAAKQLDWGARNPYDDPEAAWPAKDWAHAAVRGILDELSDLPGIGQHLDDIDLETRMEIVRGLADVVRAAFIRRAA